MNTNTLKRFALLVVLSLTSYGLWAQIPSGYYNGTTGKTGEELKVALHEIIKDHTTISYQNIWSAFWSTDNKGNNVVWDMYSDGANYSYSYYDNDQCGEYEQEGDCFNREHSWPQSWFNNANTPTTDLHHIFPTDGFVNAQRSNFPFGEVNNAAWTSQNGSKLGPCKSSLGYSGTVFEPIDEYKGDFARALMYISVRYYSEDDDWSSSGMTNKSVIEDWAINMLLNWSDNDPVSQKEIDRNNVIYNDIQHNRNPFIDNPDYARMIWDPNWHGGGSIGNGDFVKVTSSDEITDGDYLIVCENKGVAFNGALNSLDAAGNTIGITITGSVIASSEVTNAAIFTIASRDNGYSIKSSSGYYIGQTSNNNGLASSTTTVYNNTLSINNGDVDIVSAGAYLRYNASSDQKRFRYFKSSTYSGQQAIQLYKKTATYSITLASVVNGSISASAEEAVEGAIITLTATPDLGYEFDHWLVTDAANHPVAVTDNQFEMPASNVTVSAVFVYVGEPFVQQYYLVTSTDQLVEGRTYLIVNTEYNKALGITQNTNNRSAAVVTIDNNIISTLGDACELTLGGQTDAWTLYDATNNGYLYAAGGNNTNNYLKTQTTLTTAGKWTITLNNNKATIKTIDSGVNRHTIMYNNTGNIFSCYASGQKDVCLFIRSEEYDHVENETIDHLFSFDNHTVRSGVTLTVSGTATCDDANHLTLEDGAQLVHHNNGVKATFKKSIDAYTTDGGWYTIAAPFASYTPSGTMIADNYDFYAYDEDADLEWVNYKSNATGFAMEAGMGYLYAHNPGTVLRMAGTLNSGDYTQTVNLSYASSNTSLKGFNLLGNPTAHDITFSKTGDVSDGYYYLANSEDWEYATSNTVPVGRGFLVKANAANQTVTLNPQSKGGDNEKGQYICLSIGEEKAYVKLDEGVSMPLLSLKGEQASLYLTREGKQFVMLVRDDAPSLDLNFKARHNGEQTLKVDLQSNALDYLHLIDNKTGADIDLLAHRQAQGPASYSFEATTDDYESRFRLLFSAQAPEPVEGPDQPFAFVSNGNIIVSGEGTLQVVDIMGRILLSRDAARQVSTIGMPSGVYVLRLISGDVVKTQKIVVN